MANFSDKQKAAYFRRIASSQKKRIADLESKLKWALSDLEMAKRVARNYAKGGYR